MKIPCYHILFRSLITDFCIGMFLLFPYAGFSWAVPANPRPVKASQSDGTKVNIVLKGDEYYHWYEDGNGYTILKDIAAKNWVYAEKNPFGALKAGKNKVGIVDPVKLGLNKRLLDIQRVNAAMAKRAKVRSTSSSRVLTSRSTVSVLNPVSSIFRAPILTGTMKNLVILARFSDQSVTHTQAEFINLFNQSGYAADGAAGSVQDYYKEVSYNKLTMQSVVSVWVTLPHTAAYYGVNDADGYDLRPDQMVTDAVNALAATGFDFSTVDGNGDGYVDGLDIIHSGRGEEWGGNNTDYIWSHESELNTAIVKNGVKMQMYHTESEVRGWDNDPSTWGIARIGVICHETGHFLGLPDLYDTTYATSGVGAFCLMSGGAWNGNEGTLPAHMSAWCKKTLGWAAPTQLTTIGTKSLARIEDGSSAMYLLRDSSFPSYEYFLVENRQGYGFDSGLPGSTRGILIWHVDESVANNDDYTHYMVALQEASGTQDLRQLLGTNDSTVIGDDFDYFRSGNNTNFDDTTTPNSKSYAGLSLKLPISAISAAGNPMSFYLGTTDVTPPTAIVAVYDGLGADISMTGSLTQLSANWTDSSDPETGVSGYWYAIGTAAGSANMVDWTYIGAATSVTRSGLSLTNGITYYFGVKSVNGVGIYSNVTWSNGQIVDINSPSDIPYVNDGTSSDIQYISSLNTLSANWGASIHSSGINHYEYAIGTTPGGTNTAGWTSVGLNLSVTRSSLPLIENQVYYFSVKAQNNNLIYSNVSVSNGQRVDVTSPTASIHITSMLPAKVGALTLKLTMTESLIGNPSLSFTPVSGSAHTVTMSYLASNVWSGSASIDTSCPSGAAVFAFSAVDLAGNTGTLLTSGGAFLIDTSTISGVTAGGGMDNMKAYPNPWYFDKASFLIIKGIPPDAVDPKIYIYNTGGELVRTLERGAGIDSSNNGEWNGRNAGGAKAASGLYLYIVTTGNYGKASGKFYIFW